MEEDLYFNEIYTKVKNLNKKQYKLLDNYIQDMDYKINQDFIYMPYSRVYNFIKRNKSRSKILYITFNTKNKNKLAHICKYIIDLENYNQEIHSMTGNTIKTILAWYDIRD